MNDSQEMFVIDTAEHPTVDLFGNAVEIKTKLRDRFLEPPFSVLNANGGDWMKRKQAWSRLGIKSELTREHIETYGDSITKLRAKLSPGSKELATVSIFDPVLCELFYRWFCPEGGAILDPFAGGSVRGIVAKYLGYNYAGVDLSVKQIAANIENAKEIFKTENPSELPRWFCGDSEEVLSSTERTALFDCVFSCPPYADLEVYSDNAKDLSNMTYQQFVDKYRRIIALAVRLLKRGGYAVFVVGEVRDKRTGYYYGFVQDTIKAFVDAGAGFYNDSILVTAYGTAMLRTHQFTANRKMVKVHQNILVFKKY